MNQNISMRGILGVESVMFMEDGMPVFPTMHTFFMNADNLFRFDNNIERMEVVRGGASALFGSNTPGAIINFINKTGSDQFTGTTRLTGGTEAYARYDLNANGPLGDDWRFNVGGFYRYDHGVRDPGFTGINGGQIKASLTRRLENGYIRASVKYLNDRNQFILPLPFTNPDDPEYVQGFSDYGSMNTNEGLDLEVPTPDGKLRLPLDNGLRTDATWFTIDAAFDLPSEWHLQNTAQAMRNDQEWNALLGNNLVTAADFITESCGRSGSRPARRRSSSIPTTSTPSATDCRMTTPTAWWRSPASGTSRSRSRRFRTSSSSDGSSAGTASRWGRTSRTTPRRTSGTSPTSSPTCGTTPGSWTW